MVLVVFAAQSVLRVLSACKDGPKIEASMASKMSDRSDPPGKKKRGLEDFSRSVGA